MIRSVVRTAARVTGKEEVVIVPLFEGDKTLPDPVKQLDKRCRAAISRTIRSGRFKASRGKVFLLSHKIPRVPDHVMLLGCGKRADANAERMAIAGGAASRAAKTSGFKTLHVLIADDETMHDQLAALIKGVLLAQYEYKIASSKTKSGTRKLALMTDDATGVAAAIQQARVTAERITAVRDMVNAPADRMTPTQMAAEAKKLAKEHGFLCKVMGLRDLKRLKMGAVLAVAKGSREEPKFITMHYNRGRRNLPRICLVGKGVTFDTGGISIKPWNNMNEMKGDMAGGAVVINTVAAAAQLKLPMEIIGLVPCVENMPDGLAFRPGDVIATYSGKTIEVLSTDAEGRLILSDALTYACEFKPDAIVDFATLTGAVVIALGTRIAGIMGSSQKHMDRLLDAGKASGELLWQLPLDDVFIDMIRGDISDYKNYSGREGSSITAAALLAEFVGKTPWVHMDIAGTFWSSSGSVSYQPKGATGFGVDVTLRYLQSLLA